MNTNRVNQMSRADIEQKYKTARNNLLLMLILTVVNIVLYVAGSDTMMLFSATVPYFGIVFGMATGIPAILAFCICISAAILITYLLCWILSKNHYGWMIASLVLFIIDTLAMIGMYLMIGEVSGILDVVIHVWVLYYLVIGVRYGKQLKTMPEETENSVEQTSIEQAYTKIPEGMEDMANSHILRMADTTVKSRILLEADAAGHHICYRRVKRINELVIDGHVYDDVEMLVEGAHALNARLDGHVFQAGFDGVAHSYIRVDGVQVARKLRWY